VKNKFGSFVIFLIFLFCFFTDNASLFAQNLAQIQKKAESNFKALNYAAAQVEYRQLLAQDPKSIDFNFKYAVCVYYSDERNTAKKYFEFAAQSPQAPTSVNFYLGKLNHFEYKFQKAISYYELYLKNTTEKNREFDANKEIERCNQGIVLLENPVSLRLISMKKSSIQNFYLEYVFESRLGRFFTDVAFQSKNDKKYNHVPLYYFVRGEQYKIFSSYGPNNQKDIYFCKKLSSDSWSSPSKILGTLNTEANEDFPFYDAKSSTLYFSSDGHNSMGGFDVFKIYFDPLENITSNCENLDFPYSSSSDDYLFVPDDTLNQAYFASNRNSSKSQLLVYSVINTKSTSTIQLIKGIFVDVVNPKNFTAQISAIDQESNITYGPYATNEQGEYNLLLPGGGEFKFIVTVEGSNKQFENLATVPFVKSKQILKQELLYQIVAAEEEVLFLNKFKPFDASEEDQLNVLTAMASFNINPSLKSNLQLKPAENTTQSILSSIGIKESDENLALDQLQDALIEVELLPEEIEISIAKLAKIKQESYQALKDIQKQIELKEEELNTANSVKSREVAEKEFLALQNQLLVQQQYIIAIDENLASYNKQIEKNSAIQSVENSTSLGAQLKELRFKENEDSLNNFLNLNQQKIKELISLVNPGFENDFSSRSEEHSKSIKELTSNISEEELRLKKIEEQIILDSKSTNTLSKKETLALNKKIEVLKNEQKTIQESLIENNKELFIQDQRIEVLKLQNEILNDLEKIKVQKDIDLSSENNFAKVNFESLIETHENKLKIEVLITQQQLVKDPLIFLQNQEDSLLALNTNQDQLNQLLSLKNREEVILKDRLRSAENTNNLDLVEKIQEQLQLLENNKIKIQNSLLELDTVNLAKNQTQVNKTTEEERLAANPVTEEQTPINTQVNKTTEEERLAANPVIDEQTPINTQVNKTTEEERLAANPLTEEQIPNTQSNNTTEEERLAANPLTEEQIPTNTQSNKTTEEERLAANPVTEEQTPINTQSNKTTEEERLAANPVTEEQTPINTQVNKITEEERLAANPLTEDQIPINTQSNKTTEEERLAANTVTEEQIPINTQNNKTAEEERLAANTVTEEQTPVNNQSNKSIEENQKVVEKYSESMEQVNEINVEISKLTKASIEEKNVNTDLIKIGQINTIQTISQQQEKLILFDEKLELLKIFDSNLERSLNQNKLDQISILQMQKEIIKSEIPLISDKTLLSVYENQIKLIDQLINDFPITPVLENEKEAISFAVDASSDKTSIQQLAALPNYITYLNQRKEYTDQQKYLDSLEQLKITITQELFQLMQMDTVPHELNASTLIKANVLKEVLLKIEQTESKQAILVNQIKSTKNQAAFEKLLQDHVSPIIPLNINSNILPESFAWNPNGSIVPQNISTPIPILKKLPTGLYYRVQIGAFRKPIANDKFRGFSPVSGEVIANGLTCYLAGFFGEINKAVNAKGQIRKMGYNDAFIVAYCDGKRITIAQARQYELNGLCKKNTENEINIELAAIYKEEKENLEAIEPIPLNDEVYLTVQVGVFAKTINEGQLPGINELTYTKAPNGLLRYASGKFDDINEARKRKKLAIEKGVKDAFIVAYRNGIRISIQEAQNYIAQKAYINTNEQISKTLEINFKVYDNPPPPKIEWVQFRQDIKKETATKQLGIVNRAGTFVYNEKENVLISGKINREDISPFEQIYLAQMHLNLVPETNKNITWIMEDLSLTAQLHDWLLQSSIPFSIIKSQNVLQIQFVVAEDSELEFLIKAAEKFNFNYF
jgi:hypothetical protein